MVQQMSKFELDIYRGQIYGTLSINISLWRINEADYKTMP